MNPQSLGKLAIHDEDYCPSEIWGALDGPLEDGQIHGVHVCTVEGDDPLPIAQEIVRRWNAFEGKQPITDADIERVYQEGYDKNAGPPQFRHSVNHDLYHRAGLRAVVRWLLANR